MHHDVQNWEFVHLLLKLVDEEQHIMKLRNGSFAFTVDYWGQIRLLGFILVLILHTIVILGAYSEPWYSPYQGANDHNTTPLVAEVVMYLTYANAVISFVRALSFAMATFPIIIDEYKHNQEKGQIAGYKNIDSQITTLEAGVAEQDDDLARVIGITTGVNGKNGTTDGEVNASGLDGDKTSAAGIFFQQQKIVVFVSDMGTGCRALVLRSRFWYEVLLFGSAVFAAIYNTPMPTAVTLLDILFWKANRALVHAVAHNGAQLFSTVKQFLKVCILKWSKFDHLEFRLHVYNI